jgi:Dolichyl-phosphate-mannose-protein mannosyltransferase
VSTPAPLTDAVVARAPMREDRVGRGQWIGLAILAVGVRAVYVLTAAPRKLPYTDALFYHLQGNQISHGQWFVQPLGVVFLGQSRPSAAHPPLYSLVLAGASSVGARSLRAHELVGCVIGLGTVLGVTLLTRNLAGRRAGLIAGVLAAIYPLLWLNDGGVMSEGLYALVIVLVLLASYRFVREPSVVSAAMVGGTVGLAALVRAEAILLALILLVPLVGFFSPRRRPTLIAVALASCALVLAPWVARNMIVFSRPVTISTGDSTVAGANCPQTYHGSAIGLWQFECYAHPPAGDESVASAFWRRQGASYASHHVRQLPLVATVRVARIWGVFRPLQTLTAGSDDGRARWTNWLAMFSYWMLAPFGLVGLVLLWRQNVPVLPLIAQLALVTVSALLVWGAVRFRVPAEIVLVVGAGVTLDSLLRHRRARDLASER